MKAIGFVATLLALAGVVAAVVAAVSSSGDIKRYIKIRSM